MFCQKCGQQISADSKFCENCGTLTPGATPPNQQPLQQPMQQPFQQPMQQPLQQPVYRQGYQQPMNNFQQPYNLKPPKKKSGCGKFLLIIGVIVVIAIFAIVGYFVVGGIFGNKDITQIVMASEVDPSNNEPIIKTNVFTPTSPIVNCTLLSKLPVGTGISAEWVYLDTPESITTITYVTKLLPEKINFSLSMPDAGWPVGKYQVNLSFGGKLYKSVKFEVKSGTNITASPTLPPTQSPTLSPTTKATQAASSIISDVRTSLKINTTTMEPITLVSIFNTTTPQIFVTFKINNVPVGSPVHVEWVYTTSQYSITTWDANTTEKSQNVQCSLKKPDSDWPVGEYEVKISLNGTYVTSALFSVK